MLGMAKWEGWGGARHTQHNTKGVGLDNWGEQARPCLVGAEKNFGIL